MVASIARWVEKPRSNWCARQPQARPPSSPSVRAPPGAACSQPRPIRPVRSEEHTSELQSLMRISYAVFCLKKKILKSHHTHVTLFLFYLLHFLFYSTHFNTTTCDN